jgi:hypothetical protein
MSQSDNSNNKFKEDLLKLVDQIKNSEEIKDIILKYKKCEDDKIGGRHTLYKQEHQDNYRVAIFSRFLNYLVNEILNKHFISKEYKFPKFQNSYKIDVKIEKISKFLFEKKLFELYDDANDLIDYKNKLHDYHHSIEYNKPILELDIYLLYEVFRKSDYLEDESTKYFQKKKNCQKTFSYWVKEYLNYYASTAGNRPKTPASETTTANTNNEFLSQKRKKK